MRVLRVLVALALLFGQSQAAPAGCACSNVVITPSEQSCLLGHLLQIITALVNNQDSKCTKELMQNLTRSCPHKPSIITPNLWKCEKLTDADDESVTEPEKYINKPVSVKKPESKLRPEIKPEVDAEPKPETESELNPQIELEPKPEMGTESKPDSEVDEKPGTVVEPSLLPIPLPPILQGPQTGSVFKGLEPEPNSVEEPEAEVPEADSEASPTTDPVTEADAETSSTTELVTEEVFGSEQEDQSKADPESEVKVEPEEKSETEEKLQGKLESEATPVKEVSEEKEQQVTEAVPETESALVKQKQTLDPEAKPEEEEAVPEPVTTTEFVTTTELVSTTELVTAAELVTTELVPTTEPILEDESDSNSEADDKPIPPPVLPPALSSIFGGPLPGILPPAPVEQKTAKPLPLLPGGIFGGAETKPEESDSEVELQPVPFPLLPTALPLPKPGGISGGAVTKLESIPAMEVSPEMDTDSEDSESNSATVEEHEHTTAPVSDESSASDDNNESHETDEVGDEQLQNETTTRKISESTESDETIEDNKSDSEETTENIATTEDENVTESAETEEIEAPASKGSVERLLKKKDELLANAHKLLDEAHEMLKWPDKIKKNTLQKIKITLPSVKIPELGIQDELKSLEVGTTTQSPETIDPGTTVGINSSEEETTTSVTAESTTVLTKALEESGIDDLPDNQYEDAPSSPLPLLFPAIPPLVSPAADLEQDAALEPGSGGSEPVLEPTQSGEDSLEHAAQPIPSPIPPLPALFSPVGNLAGGLAAPKEEGLAVSEDTGSEEDKATVPEKQVKTETILPETTEAVPPAASSEEIEAATEPEVSENEDEASEAELASTVPSDLSTTAFSTEVSEPEIVTSVIPPLFPQSDNLPAPKGTAEQDIWEGEDHTATSTVQSELEPLATSTVPSDLSTTTFATEYTTQQVSEPEIITSVVPPSDNLPAPKDTEDQAIWTGEDHTASSTVQPDLSTMEEEPIAPEKTELEETVGEQEMASEEESKETETVEPDTTEDVPPETTETTLQGEPQPAISSFFPTFGNLFTGGEKQSQPLLPPLSNLFTPKKPKEETEEATLEPLATSTVPSDLSTTTFATEYTTQQVSEPEIITSVVPPLDNLSALKYTENQAIWSGEDHTASSTVQSDLSTTEKEPIAPEKTELAEPVVEQEVAPEEESKVTEIVEPDTTEEVPPETTEPTLQGEPQPAISSFFPTFGNLATSTVQSDFSTTEKEPIASEKTELAEPVGEQEVDPEEESKETETVEPDTTEEVPPQTTEPTLQGGPQPAISSFIPTFGNVFTGGEAQAPPKFSPLNNLFTPKEPKEEKEGTTLEPLATYTVPSDLSTTTFATEYTTQQESEPEIITSVVPPSENLPAPKDTEDEAIWTGEDHTASSTVHPDLSITEEEPIAPEKTELAEPFVEQEVAPEKESKETEIVEPDTTEEDPPETTTLQGEPKPAISSFFPMFGNLAISAVQSDLSTTDAEPIAPEKTEIAVPVGEKEVDAEGESKETETVKPDTTEEVPPQTTEPTLQGGPQPTISSFIPTFGNVFTGGESQAPPLFSPLNNLFTPEEPKEEKEGTTLEPLATSTVPSDLSTTTFATEYTTQQESEPEIITSVVPPSENLPAPKDTEDEAIWTGEDHTASSTVQPDLSTTEEEPIASEKTELGEPVGEQEVDPEDESKETEIVEPNTTDEVPPETTTQQGESKPAVSSFIPTFGNLFTGGEKQGRPLFSPLSNLFTPKEPKEEKEGTTLEPLATSTVPSDLSTTTFATEYTTQQVSEPEIITSVVPPSENLSAPKDTEDQAIWTGEDHTASSTVQPDLSTTEEEPIASEKTELGEPVGKQEVDPEEESKETEMVEPNTTDEVPPETTTQQGEPKPAISSFIPTFGNLFTGGEKQGRPLFSPLSNLFTPKEPKEEKEGTTLEPLATSTVPSDLSTTTFATEYTTPQVSEPKIITSVVPPVIPPLDNLLAPEDTEDQAIWTGKDYTATSTMQCDLSTTEADCLTPYSDLPKIESASPKIDVPEIHAEMKAPEGPEEGTPNMGETFNTAVESTTKAMCEHRRLKYPHTLFIPVLKFDETPAYTADELLEYVYNMYKTPKQGLRIDQNPFKDHEHHKCD